VEIENSIKSTSGASVNKTRNRSAEQASTTSAPPSSKTSVEFSELSTQLKAASDTSFDATRVSQIKQAIAEGRFMINTDAIAERLLTSARELVSAQRRA
jgi:negative regulator of flagellin synthesis FlgM